MIHCVTRFVRIPLEVSYAIVNQATHALVACVKVSYIGVSRENC